MVTAGKLRGHKMLNGLKRKLKLKAALRSAIKMLEFNPIVSPAHICSPETICDELCHDYAKWEQQILEFKDLVSDA